MLNSQLPFTLEITTMKALAASKIETVMSTGHSITALLSGVKRREQEAIFDLFAKCYSRVRAIAIRKLGGTAGLGFDEDDITNSAFLEFLSRAAVGHFKKLENRDDVWQILTLLVVDTIWERRRREGRLKRGGGKPSVSLQMIEAEIANLDDPSLEVDFADATSSLLQNVPSDDHRRVVELLIDGNTHKEIAHILRLSVRTVDRRIEDIRIALPTICDIDVPKKKSGGQRRGGGKADDYGEGPK